MGGWWVRNGRVDGGLEDKRPMGGWWVRGLEVGGG